MRPPVRESEETMSGKKRDDSRKPWVSNYSLLKEWLERIEARCQVQEYNEARSVEIWMANDRLFIVLVYGDGNGWEIFTTSTSNDVAVSLEDAERRLGIKS